MKQFNFDNKLDAYLCVCHICEEFENGWDLIYCIDDMDIPSLAEEFWNILPVYTDEQLLEKLTRTSPVLIIQNKLHNNLDDTLIDKDNEKVTRCFDATEMLKSIEDKPSHNSKSVKSMKDLLSFCDIVIYSYKDFLKKSAYYNIVVNDDSELADKIEKFIEENK